jgi:hypothetical protein
MGTAVDASSFYERAKEELRAENHLMMQLKYLIVGQEQCVLL